ncbi:CG42686, partial [Drosophila busckii]
MEDASAAPTTKKSGTTLSVDRAAFLLLRVKKAFKKKRQQRKERQAQQSGAAAAALATGVAGNQSRNGSRKWPPPLLRSRTLPAIIVPGLPVVSLHTDKQTFHLDERLLGCKSRSGSASGHRWSLLSRGGNAGSSQQQQQNNNNINLTNNNNNNTLMVKSLNLPKDDSTLAYRRKSSGSTPSHHQQQQQQQQQHVAQQHLHLYQQHAADSTLYQLSDDFECHADGSLFLRIPAPYVAPSRGYPYRMPATKRASTSSEATTPLSREQQQPHAQLHDFPMAESSASGMHMAFTRLAKLMHQSSARSHPPPALDSTYKAGELSLGLGLGPAMGEETPRRLSWERRKDSSALQRSASIDSFAEIVFSDMPRPSLDIPRSAAPTPFSKRPSASSLYSTCSSIAAATASSSQAYAQLNVNYGELGAGAAGHGATGSSSAGSSRRESMLSPSSTRRNKLTRIIN